MFAWGDYLTLAQFLEQHASQTGTQEAALRSSISRAYYAAYGLMRRWASQHPGAPFVPTRTGSDHSQLREWLRRSGFTVEAQELERLHKRRKQCDYDDVLSQALNVACQQALLQAEDTLKALGITS